MTDYNKKEFKVQEISDENKGEIALKILYNFNIMLKESAAYAEAQATNPNLDPRRRRHWEAPYTCFSGLSAMIDEAIGAGCDGELIPSAAPIFPPPSSIN